MGVNCEQACLRVNCEQACLGVNCEQACLGVNCKQAFLTRKGGVIHSVGVVFYCGPGDYIMPCFCFCFYP